MHWPKKHCPPLHTGGCSPPRLATFFCCVYLTTDLLATCEDEGEEEEEEGEEEEGVVVGTWEDIRQGERARASCVDRHSRRRRRRRLIYCTFVCGGCLRTPSLRTVSPSLSSIPPTAFEDGNNEGSRLDVSRAHVSIEQWEPSIGSTD